MFIESFDINLVDKNSFETKKEILFKFNKSLIGPEITNALLVLLQKIIKIENGNPITDRLTLKTSIVDFSFKVIKEFQGFFDSSNEAVNFYQQFIYEVTVGFNSLNGVIHIFLCQLY